MNVQQERDESLLARTRQETIRMWRDLFWVILKSTVLLFKVFYEFFVPRPLKDVSGQVAFITGGAKGLGRELALNLAKKGCHIAVVDLDIEGAKETANELKSLGVKAAAFKADVSKAEDIDAIKGAVEKQLGPVDIVINNAGVFWAKAIESETPEALQKMIDINLMSNFWTTRAFLQGMIDRKRGHIASLSSIAGLFGVPHAVCYSASKFGVRGFMEGLALDLHHRNIHSVHVTAIFPHFIDTNPFIRTTVLEGSRHKVILDPIKTGQTIIDGILRNEEIIALPRFFYYTTYLLSASMGLKKLCTTVLTEPGYGGPKVDPKGNKLDK